jgi:staphylococcal nuclease domain-containing protein 1
LCCYSFIKLVTPESDYFVEATDRFKELCYGKKLVVNIDHKEGTLLHLRLIDPTSSEALSDSNACINVDLVAEGFALIDRKGCRYLSAYPGVHKKLQEAVGEAKRHRCGMFEFGDVEEDD